MTVRARCVLEDVTNTVTGVPGKACEDLTNVPEVSGKELEADVPSPPSPATSSRRGSCAGSADGSCIDAQQLPEHVAACAGDLCQLWARCATESAAALYGGGGAFLCTSCMHVVLQRFSRMGPPGFAGALLNPPPTMPPPLSRAASSQQAGTEPCLGHGDTGGAHASVRPLGTMAEALESRWEVLGDDPDLCADAALRDVLGRVLQAYHEESQSHLPVRERILSGLGSRERDQILLWLLQVCDLRSLPDSVFYMAVVLFDRYCAVLEERIPTGHLHLKVLAILSISMKVTGGADDTRKPWKLRELLACLGQQQHSVEDIFREEVKLLCALSFEVSAPSALDFLDALVLPFTQPDRPEASSPVVILAKFLLQLSLLDASLHYRYPHAVLAAGAVYVALWCTRAKPARVAALLGDVAAAAGGACGGSECSCEGGEGAEAFRPPCGALQRSPPPSSGPLPPETPAGAPPARARSCGPPAAGLGARPGEPPRAADAGPSCRRPQPEGKGGHTARALRRL